MLEVDRHHAEAIINEIANAHHTSTDTVKTLIATFGWDEMEAIEAFLEADHG